MDVLWIPLLTTLGLLSQTSTYEKSSARVTEVVLLANTSDSMEVTKAVLESVTFRTPTSFNSTKGNGLLWSVNGIPIVTVQLNPLNVTYHQEEYKPRFAVSEDGALSISPLRVEDAGNYSLTGNGRTQTYTLWVVASATDPPSPGARSGSSDWIFWIIAGAVTLVVLLLVFLAFYCKSRVPSLKEWLRGSAGSQCYSQAAAEDHVNDIEVPAEESV